jgi:hypothetical protein
LSGALWAQAGNPLTAAVRERFDRIRLDFEESADLMPADKYDFRLTPAQRTFGEWIGHTAAGLYGYCSAIQGSSAPEAAKHVHHLKAKAELSKGIKDAFAYCDAALKATNDQKALASPAAVRGMINLVASPNEHYGNIVGYMRASGLVPPSTARAQKKKK